MKSFLEECAEDILRKYDSDNTVCVVFPNNRTLLNFRKIYAALKNEVAFSGAMYPINKILNQFCKSNNADELTLLFKLYEAFRAVFDRDGMLNQNLALDFNSFFDTGRKMLSDFNEIDNYLVDVNQLCHNFADINELDSFYSTYDPEVVEIIRTFWNNFSQEKLSKEKERYKELWIHLPEVYALFRSNLEKDNASYSGMANRRIVDIIRKGKLQTRFKTYVFVGFNVLNKCERAILGYLNQSGMAKFYWDADNYYIADHAQEAGLFMRQYLSDFPDELYRHTPPSNIIGAPKDVEYIGVPLEVAQAKSVHDILDSWTRMPDFQESRTAVVLGDEHLLFPVLNSIPESVRQVNVTMGYPFVDTPVYSFLLNCLQLRKNLRHTHGVTDFYFKDVLAVINHPLVVNIQDFYSQAISQKIQDERMVRVKADFLSSFSNILSLIFKDYDQMPNPIDILTNYLEILSELYFIKNPVSSNTPKDESPKLENEFIYKAYTSVKGLYNNFEQLPVQQIDADLVISILKQHLMQIKVPFESDDDRGIQVIGMMETRNLDFDNVVLLGMNEGIFPKRSENDSFITEGMRLAFDMPIVKYKDSVFGYFFYRLFQRAKNVKVLYNNVFATNISGEPSRFATQLDKEASQSEREDSNLRITKSQFSRLINPKSQKPLDVDSNEDSVSRLSRYIVTDGDAAALSPSAVNTYINCPLMFYMRYVLSLKPMEELDEEGSMADFGSILHRSIENLYKFVKDDDGFITAQAIDSLAPIKEQYMIDAYNEQFFTKIKSRNELSGFESVFFDVLMQYLERILFYDKQIAPFRLIGAEKKVKTSISINVDGKPMSIMIGGTIDRIDYVPATGKIRILDYKTGNVANKMKFKDVDQVFDNTKAERPKEAFQVLFYSYVYMQTHPGQHPSPVIYGVRNDITPANSVFTVGEKKDVFQVTDNNIGRLVEDYVVKLKELLAEIFSPNQKFQKCEGKHCEYCDFRAMCK